MRLVLDTNIVLDLLVFSDPQVRELSARLAAGALDWMATGAMREELARVLAYPGIAARLALQHDSAALVLQEFDRRARLVETAPRASVTCGDPDDQKFIDLAVAHRCVLLSKDREVLRLGKRLALLHVTAARLLPPQAAT